MALRPVSGFDPALRARIVSALVLAAVALAATLLGGWPFIVMVLAAVVVMAGEWCRLGTGAPSQRKMLMAGTALVPTVAVLVLAGDRLEAAAALLLGGALLLGLVAATGALGVRPLRAGGGAIYVGAPALALVWLRSAVPNGTSHLVWLLLVIWATDICAYLVGRSLGGPKLAPTISPGKTWSGLMGGIAGASLVGAAAAQAPGFGYALAAALGGCLAVVGQAGDLFESALKRRAGVKDSGHLIPGHGGLLDRIDGLIFAAPVFAGIVWFVFHAGPTS